MKTGETLNKAYGNIPKEVPRINLYEFGPVRGIKYYWIKFIRRFTR
jgi:hypothetical protein